MENLTQKKGQPHVVMVMMAGVGHVTPFLQLLYHIARYNGATVTIATNEDAISELNRLQSEGEFHALDLRMEAVFETPIWDYSDSKFPIKPRVMLQIFTKNFQPFANKWIKEKGRPGCPTCLIADSLLAFTQGLAAGLEIPWYPVCTSPPGMIVSFLEGPKLGTFVDTVEACQPEGGFGTVKAHKLLDVPGLKYARLQDLPDGVLAGGWWNSGDTFSRASAIPFNTAAELDAPTGALDAVREITQLSAQSRKEPGPKIYAIGPLVNFPGFTACRPRSTKNDETVPSSPLMDFLNAQAVDSVLYICFGSFVTIELESIRELAHGLEASGVPFVWALRLRSFWGSEPKDVLPTGFEERLRGRCYIDTGFVPQAKILSHSSTGGYLTHCGWNSILESFCSAVPLITWPVNAEQHLNGRFVETVVNTGISVMQKQISAHKNCIDGKQQLVRNNSLPSSDDVLWAVNFLMKNQKGKDLRKNAEKMKEVVTAAVAEDGSSYRDLRIFLDEVMLSSHAGK